MQSPVVQTPPARQHPARRARRIAAVAAVGVLALFGAACGEDDEVSTTTSTTRPGAPAPTNAADEGGGGDNAVLEEIESRGKPSLSATDPVTELVVTDDVVGTGAEVQAGDEVTVHYVGVSASTGQEFDSSWRRGETISFPLSGVIQGWSEGLVGMKVGGRRTLVIPPEQAYGNSPPPGSGIAPGETLVFTVDMVATN
jgi:peptidylprolyl isomerase